MSGLRLRVVEEHPAPPLGKTVIKVVGIGGGGCNAVTQMIAADVKGVEFVAVNTDMQALEACKAETRLAIGQKLTGGLGAGGDPDVGSRAAQEDRAVLEKHISGAHMVFITTGLGGGTGTGSAPVLAEIAKKNGALTVAIVTLPFNFEGSRKMEVAQEGLNALRKNIDALIVVPNEKLRETTGRKTSMMESFAQVNDLLRVGIQGIVDLITNPGFINVDFADVKSVMSFRGEALMGKGIGRGDNRAVDALKAAMSCPLVENVDMEGARGLLVNITGGEDFGIEEYGEVMTSLSERVAKDAVCKMGVTFDPSMRDEVSVTIIATGFDRREKPRMISAAKAFSTVSAGAESNIRLHEDDSLGRSAFDLNKFGMISGDGWDKLLSPRKDKEKSGVVELDESVPSYVRLHGNNE